MSRMPDENERYARVERSDGDLQQVRDDIGCTASAARGSANGVSRPDSAATCSTFYRKRDAER